jgi:hypothetical protein
VADPLLACPQTPNCPGFTDGNATFVTKIVIQPVVGDPASAGITELEFWLDTNVDGFLMIGRDLQLFPKMPNVFEPTRWLCAHLRQYAHLWWFRGFD